MKSTTNVLKSVLGVTALGLFLAGNFAQAAQDPNQLIVNPGSQYQGQSYDDAERAWWQTMFSVPATNGSHPLLQGGAVMDTTTGTLLLAPDPDSAATISGITIPSQTPIYVPVVIAERNSVTNNLFFGDPPTNNATAQLVSASGHIANTIGVSALINGTTVTDIQQYNNDTPQFTFSLPTNNVFQTGTSTNGTSRSASISLLIKPFPSGTTNTIRVRGTYTEANPDRVVDTLFTIVVQ